MSVIFSKTLKSLRLEQGMTQKELAAELGVSQNTVFQWENGFEPSMEKLETIADYFGVHIGQLFGNKREQPSTNEDEKELFQIFGQLDNVNKGKLLGFGKGLIELQSIPRKKKR